MGRDEDRADESTGLLDVRLDARGVLVHVESADDDEETPVLTKSFRLDGPGHVLVFEDAAGAHGGSWQERVPVDRWVTGEVAANIDWTSPTVEERRAYARLVARFLAPRHPALAKAVRRRGREVSAPADVEEV